MFYSSACVRVIYFIEPLRTASFYVFAHILAADAARSLNTTGHLGIHSSSPPERRQGSGISNCRRARARRCKVLSPYLPCHSPVARRASTDAARSCRIPPACIEPPALAVCSDLSCAASCGLAFLSASSILDDALEFWSWCSTMTLFGPQVLLLPCLQVVRLREEIKKHMNMSVLELQNGHFWYKKYLPEVDNTPEAQTPIPQKIPF